MKLRRSVPILAPVLLPVLACGLAPASRAEPPAHEIQNAEQARDAQLAAQQAAAARAAAAAAEADRLAGERVQAAAALRAAEDATSAAAAKVEALSARQRAVAAALAAHARALTPLLPVLERLSLYPSETLLAVPASPEQALRGVLVLAGMSRQLEREAAQLRAEAEEVADLRQQLAAELPKLAAAEAAQQAQADALDQQIAATQAARVAADGEAAAAADRAAQSAARADSLRAAVAQVDAAKPPPATASTAPLPPLPPPAPPPSTTPPPSTPVPGQEASARPVSSDARLTAPVAGTVVHRFGDTADAGLSNGVSYQAAPSARVVSPCAGSVGFSGPFRSYGQLLIIQCGRFDIVLAGLARLDAAVGETVKQGEPVGVMPTWDPSADVHHPTLYLELREHGDPVDPAPYLAATT